MDSQKQVEPVGEPVLDRSRVPHHVAIIMDGNGRWAQSRHLPRVAGHQQGMQTVKKVTLAASDLGIKALTLYAFSTENWKRPSTEVRNASFSALTARAMAQAASSALIL